MQPHIAHTQVCIAGAGPVGMALALGLQRQGVSVLLCEARAQLPVDAHSPIAQRALALSYASLNFLQDLGIGLSDLSPSPIDTVHISQQGSVGQTRLQASQLGLPMLGGVVAYGRLQNQLAAAVQAAGIPALCGQPMTQVRGLVAYAVAWCGQVPITAELVVLAEGGKALQAMLPQLKAQEKPYAQSALIARVRVSHAQAGVAYERFTAKGPMALLPLGGDAYALVASVAEADLPALLAMPMADLCVSLQQQFGSRLGDFTHIEGLAHFPLALRAHPPIVQNRVVLMGNAAQSLHPIAGQGLNLGLRDVADFLSSTAYAAHPLGSAAQLADYQERRKADKAQGIWLTDALVRTFAVKGALAQHTRSAGLLMLEQIPWAKRILAEQMIYGSYIA